MATERYVVRLRGTSGLPEDVYENVLYFDSESREVVTDGLAALYDGLDLIAGWQGLEVRVYDVAGGQPLFRKDYPTAAGSGQPSATEVALCLSYAAVDDVEASTPRRRGRIYLGPLNLTTVAGGRPTSAVVQRVIDFGEDLAQIGTANGTTWMLWSQTDQVAAKIEVIWCDNAWDTQRRRGWAPTTRQSFDVQ